MPFFSAKLFFGKTFSKSFEETGVDRNNTRGWEEQSDARMDRGEREGTYHDRAIRKPETTTGSGGGKRASLMCGRFFGGYHRKYAEDRSILPADEL
jgi:hypothetical protein